MPFLKLVTGKYDNSNAIDNVYFYITEDIKTYTIIGGYNIIPYIAPPIMKATKRVFDKTDGQQVIHIMFSLAPNEKLNTDIFYCYAYKISEYFQKHQVVFGIHVDTDNLHAHFMVNTISFIDVSILKSDKKLLIELRDYCLLFFPNVQTLYG